MAATDAELDSVAARHGIDLPEFFASDPRQAKGEYLAQKLGTTNKDDFEARHRPQAETYEAGAELDLEAQEIQNEHREWSYEQCLKAARRDHPNLVKEAFPKKAL